MLRRSLVTSPALRFVAPFVAAAAAAIPVAVVAFPRDAHANPMPGEGYAGKPNPSFPQGDRCGRCHTGGAVPTATLTGPTTLEAGATGSYTLRVNTNLARTGAAVAASNGVDLTAGTNMAKQVEELTHSGGPKTPQGGGTTFAFQAKAPASGTAFTLYYVGMAANNDGRTGGDNSTAILTQRVTVTGGGPGEVDAGPGGSDAGSSGGTDAGPGGTSGGTGDGGTASGGASGGTTSGGTTSGGASGTSGGSRGDGDALGDDEGGCAASGGPGSAHGAGLAALVGLTVVGLARGRRRRA